MSIHYKIFTKKTLFFFEFGIILEKHGVFAPIGGVLQLRAGSVAPGVMNYTEKLL